MTTYPAFPHLGHDLGLVRLLPSLHNDICRKIRTMFLKLRGRVLGNSYAVETVRSCLQVPSADLTLGGQLVWGLVMHHGQNIRPCDTDAVLRGEWVRLRVW